MEPRVRHQLILKALRDKIKGESAAHFPIKLVS